MKMPFHFLRLCPVVCAVMILCLIPGCRPVSAETDQNAARYRVAAGPSAYAIEEGRYDTFEEALDAAKTSSMWYIMDEEGSIVYPSPVTPADQIALTCRFMRAIAEDDRFGFALHDSFEPDKAEAACHYEPFYPFENGTQVYDSLTGLGEYGNFNCSTAQVAAFSFSGYADLLGNGSTGVGNFQEVASRNGFTDATQSVDFRTGKGLEPGDVLVYVAGDCMEAGKPAHSHMATYLGDGLLLWCTGDLDKGRDGDTSGSEIYLHEYIDWHWQTVMRPSRTEEGTTRSKITVIDGVDYAPLYDYDYYIAENPDVREAYAGDYMLTLRHYVKYGMTEGRKGRPLL